MYAVRVHIYFALPPQMIKFCSTCDACLNAAREKSSASHTTQRPTTDLCWRKLGGANDLTKNDKCNKSDISPKLSPHRIINFAKIYLPRRRLGPQMSHVGLRWCTSGTKHRAIAALARLLCAVLVWWQQRTCFPYRTRATMDERKSHGDGTGVASSSVSGDADTRAAGHMEKVASEYLCCRTGAAAVLTAFERFLATARGSCLFSLQVRPDQWARLVTLHAEAPALFKRMNLNRMGLARGLAGLWALLALCCGCS